MNSMKVSGALYNFKIISAPLSFWMLGKVSSSRTLNWPEKYINGLNYCTEFQKSFWHFYFVRYNKSPFKTNSRIQWVSSKKFVNSR